MPARVRHVDAVLALSEPLGKGADWDGAHRHDDHRPRARGIRASRPELSQPVLVQVRLDQPALDDHTRPPRRVLRGGARDDASRGRWDRQPCAISNTISLGRRGRRRWRERPDARRWQRRPNARRRRCHERAQLQMRCLGVDSPDRLAKVVSACTQRCQQRAVQLRGSIERQLQGRRALPQCRCGRQNLGTRHRGPRRSRAFSRSVLEACPHLEAPRPVNFKAALWSTGDAGAGVRGGVRSQGTLLPGEDDAAVARERERTGRLLRGRLP